jgi:hypothetical protein
MSRSLILLVSGGLLRGHIQLKGGLAHTPGIAKDSGDSGMNHDFPDSEKRRDWQKNGGRKMKSGPFAPNGGAGCLIFLTRIFLTSSSSKPGK